MAGARASAPIQRGTASSSPLPSRRIPVSLGNRTCSIAIGPNESTTMRHSDRLESPYSRTAAVTRSAGASISPKSRHTKASPRFSPASQCQEKVRAELGTRAETPGVSRSSCQMPAVVLAARARNDCAVARSVNSSSEPSRGSKPSRIPAFSSQSVSRGGATTGRDATRGPAPRAGADVRVAAKSSAAHRCMLS